MAGFNTKIVTVIAGLIILVGVVIYGLIDERTVEVSVGDLGVTVHAPAPMQPPGEKLISLSEIDYFLIEDSVDDAQSQHLPLIGEMLESENTMRTFKEFDEDGAFSAWLTARTVRDGARCWNYTTLYEEFDDTTTIAFRWACPDENGGYTVFIDPSLKEFAELDDAETAQQSAETWYHKGVALWVDDSYSDPDLAIEYFTKAVHLDRVNANTYYGRGIAYAQTGNFIAAIEDYGKAINLYSDDPLYFNNRGLAYLGLGDQAKAKVDFEKACSMGHPLGCQNLSENFP